MTPPGAGRVPGLLRAMQPYLAQVAGLLTIGSLCGIVMNTTIVLPSLLLGHALDAVLGSRTGHGGPAVTTAVLLLIAGTAATELPRVGKRYWLGVCRNRVLANVRADALRGVLEWPAPRLHTTSVGEVMARVIGDIDVLGTAVGEIIIETWDTLLFSASIAAAMLVSDPTLAALALAPVPVALLLSKSTGIAVASRTTRARAANAALTAAIQEGLTGLRVLRLSGHGASYVNRVGALASTQAEAELRSVRIQTALNPLYTTLTTSGVLAVLWLGGQQVASGALTVGTLVGFLALFTRFTGRAFRIPQMLNRVQAGRAAYARIAPLLAAPASPAAEPRHASWAAGRVAGGSSSAPRSARPRAGGPAAVELQDVTFTYPGAAAPALVHVNLQVPAGAFVAVTGPVGAGSSALARLLLGLFSPDSGVVLVDGARPDQWSAADRDQVGYLPQGHPLFSGTVASNVLLDDREEASGDGDRLAESLAVAGLSRDIEAMPSGAWTNIGEGGVKVSGGQRQRIALARALAAPAQPPRLLVLDDPFSAVDVDTEAALVTALRQSVGRSARRERQATLVVCSSRLTAFPQANIIIVLQEGHVAEQGTHAELVALGGLYAHTFRAYAASGRR